MKLHRLLALLAALSPLAACSGTPESLATQLQTALEKGDMDAVMALARIDDTPAQLRFFLLDQVRECGMASTVCTASAQPLDEEFKQSLGGLAEQGLESSAQPEGIILVQAKESDGSGSGKLQMPFAKVDGKYRLVAQRYTAAKLAALRATTNAQLLDQMLAAGIYDDASGERRTDWKDSATALPADGGEPGQALAKSAAALHAAVLAKDPDAAANSGNSFAKLIFADKDFEGKPVPLEVRKAKLHTQGLRFLHDVKVGGGWLRGNEAILLVDAKDGIGWIERGAVFLTKDGEGWNVAGTQTVNYPPQ